MRAIITVVGPDRIGIIANVCTLMAENQINIIDISQTVMEDFFTMVMLVDTSASPCTFEQIQDKIDAKQKEMNLSIRIQREDIFNAMHRI